MKDFNLARKKYEQTEIPPELNSVVSKAIKQSGRKQKGERAMKKNKLYRYTLTAAAAVVVTLTIGLNTSESFAMEMQNIPILGSLAKILTIRSYETVAENEKVDVNIPAIVEETGSNDTSEGSTTPATAAITDINAEINRICDEYVASAQIRADEYKTAFLETGGTEEEWLEHDIEIKVDYEIKTETKDYLSFILYGTESWVGAYAESHYYNLNLQTGEAVTLEELLGPDYIEKANQSILSQMEARLKEDASLSYFGDDMGGFETITADTKFYINEKQNPVIVFAKYEIAPGAFGAQEFEIQK